MRQQELVPVLTCPPAADPQQGGLTENEKHHALNTTAPAMEWTQWFLINNYQSTPVMELFVLAEANESSIPPFIHTFSITAYPIRGVHEPPTAMLGWKAGHTQTSHQFISEPKLIIQ